MGVADATTSGRYGHQEKQSGAGWNGLSSLREQRHFSPKKKLGCGGQPSSRSVGCLFRDGMRGELGVVEVECSVPCRNKLRQKKSGERFVSPKLWIDSSHPCQPCFSMLSLQPRIPLPPFEALNLAKPDRSTARHRGPPRRNFESSTTAARLWLPRAAGRFTANNTLRAGLPTGPCKEGSSIGES